MPKIEMSLRRRGFTLIEIIVCIVIVGMLATFVLPIFFSLKRDAEEAAAIQGAMYWSAEMRYGSLSGGDIYMGAQAGSTAYRFGYFGFVSLARLYGDKGPPDKPFPLNPVTDGTFISARVGSPTCAELIVAPVAGRKVGFVYNLSDAKVWPTTDNCAEWDPVAVMGK